ncbi:MAG: hypothetical protein JWM74_4333 [Myxococcaceae bacterium]|jgi:hypothetical protein|nr:hypothetical protein [Myxococcaceae bacterium]
MQTTSFGFVSVAIAALGLCLAAGCSSSLPAVTTTPDCDAIVDACHPKDPGSGPVHECHETAETAAAAHDAKTCTDKKNACVALCNAATTPTKGDAGAD